MIVHRLSPDLGGGLYHLIDGHAGDLHVLPLYLCVGQLLYSVGDRSHAYASSHNLLLPDFRDLLDNRDNFLRRSLRTASQGVFEDRHLLLFIRA